MSLSSNEMKRLEQEGMQFRKGDTKFLAQAQKALDMHGDPIDLLELLNAMWNGERPMERASLDRVGGWLTGRLSREPGVAGSRLLLELGWLKRFASIHGPADEERGGASQQRLQRSQRSQGHQRQEPAFGSTTSVNGLRRRRQVALTATAPHAASPPPVRAEFAPAAQPPLPTELPPCFVAQFDSPEAARDAKKNARDREKKGKEAKESLLAVSPVDAALKALGKKLFLCFPKTDGLSEYFLVVQNKHAGAMQPFRVEAYEVLPDGTARVIRVSIGVPSAPQKTQE